MSADNTDYSSSNFVFAWQPGGRLKRILRLWCAPLRYYFHSVYFSRFISETARRFKPRFVLGRGVGVSPEVARVLTKWLLGGRPEHLLLAGCGDAGACSEWLALRPRRTIGIDLYSFAAAWSKVSLAARERGFEIDFRQGDLVQAFKYTGREWADLVVAEAVFEHCRDLDSVLKGLNQAMVKGGLLYASYGALWYAPGGDHFSGRGGLHNVYNHLLLDEAQYMNYFRAHLVQEEAVQNGGRYVPLNLFSRLCSHEYFDLYAKNRFKVEYLGFEVSELALKFKKAHPGLWEKLLQRYPRFSAEEFLIKSHWVWLRKV